jgi:hypothetical protein
MSNPDDRPTLLAKMAKFVLNPTKDWSELDRVEPEQENGYDKQALKAMIERKRQNDFVRRREFDQLRKLRTRDASVVSALGRPSVFQSSTATDPDMRAMTLKKIDEIEAHMSKQWWKGKQDAGGTAGAGLPMAGKPAEPLGGTVHSSPLIQGDQTGEESDFKATEMGDGMEHHQSTHVPLANRRGALAGNALEFSTSQLFAIDDAEMATDPELEEAAIRFANGDDAGAESGLLQALRGPEVLPDVALSWFAALLDLYRSTHARDRFEKAVQEFDRFLEGRKPQWMAIGADVSAALMPVVSPATPVQDVLPPGMIWNCPSELTEQAMEDLRNALGEHPMPWHLGWSRVTDVSAGAMPLLSGLFSSLCNEPVALRFTGGDHLVQILRAMMPSGDRTVNMAWWSMRLDMLRAMHLQDEFEMVALDYCVTYEVAPPVWIEARCQYESVVFKGPAVVAGEHSKPSYAATAPMDLDGAPAINLSLRGLVVGDATQGLSCLEAVGQSGDRIVVSCMDLMRVDFAAAGSILNWVAMRQADGCRVEFRGVQRLVAAFFNVIGINEHAQVVPRSM